jgi:hypothetical protein
MDSVQKDNICSNIPSLQTFTAHLFVALDVPSDDGQWWPKHVKAVFYIFILNVLHLMGLTTHSRKL